jgi:hypothetical protein
MRQLIFELERQAMYQGICGWRASSNSMGNNSDEVDEPRNSLASMTEGLASPHMWLLVLAYEKACKAAEATGSGCSAGDERAMARALLDAYRMGLRAEDALVSAMVKAREKNQVGLIN